MPTSSPALFAKYAERQNSESLARIKQEVLGDNSAPFTLLLNEATRDMRLIDLVMEKLVREEGFSPYPSGVDLAAIASFNIDHDDSKIRLFYRALTTDHSIGISRLLSIDPPDEEQFVEKGREFVALFGWEDIFDYAREAMEVPESSMGSLFGSTVDPTPAPAATPARPVTNTPEPTATTDTTSAPAANVATVVKSNKLLVVLIVLFVVVPFCCGIVAMSGYAGLGLLGTIFRTIGY